MRISADRTIIQGPEDSEFRRGRLPAIYLSAPSSELGESRTNLSHEQERDSAVEDFAS